MGIIDPDAKAKEEAARIAADIALRKAEARAGEWEVVPVVAPPSTTESTLDGATVGTTSTWLARAKKREEEEEAESAASFQFQPKGKRPIRYLDEADNDGLGEIKVKRKEENLGTMAKRRKQEEVEEEARKVREALVWEPIKWGSRLVDPDTKGLDGSRKQEPRQEEEGLSVGEDQKPDVSTSPNQAAMTGSSSANPSTLVVPIPTPSTAIDKPSSLLDKEDNDDIKPSGIAVESPPSMASAVPPPALFKKRRGAPSGAGRNTNLSKKF